MGTKNNPGSFDCYEAAHSDEPMFVLLARDPTAAPLVRIWASVRSGDGLNAMLHFCELMRVCLPRYSAAPTALAKRQEAVDCAQAMTTWKPADVG